jgi:hypothetical protein
LTLQARNASPKNRDAAQEPSQPFRFLKSARCAPDASGAQRVTMSDLPQDLDPVA